MNQNAFDYVTKTLGQRHFYHMVNPGPWPFITANQIFCLVMVIIGYMHGHLIGVKWIIIALLFVILALSYWFRDVIREGTFEGMHTRLVKKNLISGFGLFIISEIMFFFGFFWAYFYCSLDPAIEVGCIWPPVGITPIDAFKLPLLNTCLLLQSGMYITVSHIEMRQCNVQQVFKYFIYALICGTIFPFIQLYEYIKAPFTIADGIYGSTFYSLTGFHGLHVLTGLLFSMVCFIRMIKGHFTRERHVGFECAIWYWHFVDVVWLFLFIFVYIWGSTDLFENIWTEISKLF